MVVEALKPSTLNFPTSEVYDEFTTYIGGELSKRRGSLLTYNVRGELGLAGSDAGEVRVSGDLQTKFKLSRKTLPSRRKDISRISPRRFTNVTIMGVTIGGIYH